MESDLEDYDFDVTINIDGVKYDVGLKITKRGFIFLKNEDDYNYDWSKDSIEQTPEWKIQWMNVHKNGQPIELTGEDLNGYFTLNPEKKKRIYDWINDYCETELAQETIDYGKSDFAYDLDFLDDDYYYNGPETYWERDN